MLVSGKKLWLPYSSREDMFPGYRHLNRWLLCVKRAHRPGTAPIFFFYCGCPCLNGKHLFLRRHGALVILHNNGLPVSFLVRLCHAAPSTVSTSLRLAGTEQRHIALSMHSYSNCIWVKLSGWSWHLADWPFHIWAYFRENALNVSLQLIVWNSSMGKRSESAKRPGPKQLAYRIAHCTKHSFTTPLIFIYYN